MKRSTKFAIILLFTFGIWSALCISSVQAAGFVPNPTGAGSTTASGCPEGTTNCGNYQLNDALWIFLIISDSILGIVGSLSLMAFVVGGLMWILSGGKAELVQKGKNTIIGAVIGLVIVFTSYTIIQLVFSALGIPNISAGQWATASWFDK